VGLIHLGHAFGDVKVIREHIELFAIAVVLLSVLPLVFELTRRRLRSRTAER
jgi:membrane-associated protein